MSEIKDLRTALGLSRAKMSALTGIPSKTIESWETGVRTPPEWEEKLVIEKLKALEGEKTMTTDEAADYLNYGRSSCTVESLSRQGLLDGALIDGELRMSRESVRKWGGRLKLWSDIPDVYEAYQIIAKFLERDYRGVPGDDKSYILDTIRASHQGKSGYQKKERYLTKCWEAINGMFCGPEWSYEVRKNALSPIEDLYHQNIIDAIENAIETFGDKRIVETAEKLDSNFRAGDWEEPDWVTEPVVVDGIVYVNAPPDSELRKKS
jgi:transcriptional regulator with XRE-family HTH domain